MLAKIALNTDELYTIVYLAEKCSGVMAEFQNGNLFLNSYSKFMFLNYY